MRSDGAFSSFGHTEDVLTTEIADGIFTKGVQICVSEGGTILLNECVGEDGLGRPMDNRTIVRVYCTIKPVLAVALAGLTQGGLIDLDSPLADYIGDRGCLTPATTVRRVLNHTAGLHRLSGVAMEMVPARGRQTLVDSYPPPPGWRVGLDAAYSEYAGWILLGELVETVSSVSLRDYLRETILDPLTMHDTWIGMTESDYDGVSSHLGVNVDLRSFQPYPLLFERSRRVCLETNPAHGGYSTATDLVRFYDALRRIHRGEAVAHMPSRLTLDSFWQSVGGRRYDEILQRECTYGLGFMIGLQDHWFGSSCSPESFGHSGNLGSSFAFVDPPRELVVAVVFNGLIDHESAFVRRPPLVRAIYCDLNETPGRSQLGYGV